MRALRHIKTLVATVALLAATGAAISEPYDDGQSKGYYEILKGKKVAFVPLSMGFDLTWFALLMLLTLAMIVAASRLSPEILEPSKETSS